jgi:heme/copper-type cytochrome/quinol oxidase subunit 3
MTTLEPPTFDRPLGRAAGRTLGWWGVVMAIFTEGSLFGLLLFCYLYLWSHADHWPLGDTPPPGVLVPALRSVLLIGSSVPAQLGARALHRGRPAAATRWIAVTIVLAAVFLAGHVQETVADWSELKPSRDAYASLFTTITNLHALHLIIGVLMLGQLARWTRQGRTDVKVQRAGEAIVLYWHFVDAVWVAVFSCLYLAVQA